MADTAGEKEWEEEQFHRERMIVYVFSKYFFGSVPAII